jgi:hypothetical protein
MSYSLISTVGNALKSEVVQVGHSRHGHKFPEAIRANKHMFSFLHFLYTNFTNRAYIELAITSCPDFCLHVSHPITLKRFRINMEIFELCTKSW